MSKKSDLYRRHRFPVQIISHCVWLHFTFPLSYRHEMHQRIESWRELVGIKMVT